LLDNGIWIYDAWFPSRPDLDGCIDDPADETTGILGTNCFPRFIIEMEKDAVLDFSLLRTATGAMRFPVLKPIQVSIARYELNPPPTTAENPDIPKLPALPDVPSIHVRVTANIPEAISSSSSSSTSTPSTTSSSTSSDHPEVVIEQITPTVTIPSLSTDDISIYQQVFKDIGYILYKMDLSYKKFWDSLTRDPDDVIDGTEKDCIQVDADVCVHVEMDLTERFVRMCSRPAVFLKEDFGYKGFGLGEPIDEFVVDFDDCPGREPGSISDSEKWNWACQQLNQEKSYTQRGWGIRAPSISEQEEFISELRRDMFKDTLLRESVADDDKLKFLVEPDDITPSFEVQGTTELVPGTESSSSSPSP